MEVLRFIPPVVVRRQEGQQEGEFYVFYESIEIANLYRRKGGFFFVIDWLGMVASDCE